jgi:hypothetical protein
MSNSFGLAIQGPQEITGNSSTTFTFPGDIAPGGYMYGFSQLNLNAGEAGDSQQAFSISLSDDGGGGSNSVTVTQKLNGFNTSSSSYVTCLAALGESLPNNLFFGNTVQTPIGTVATTNPISPTGPLAVATAALSGFSLSFGEKSDMDGIGASVGVAMNPDGTLGLLGTASLIGDEDGIDPNSTVTGSILVITTPIGSAGVGVYMQETTGTGEHLWQYVLWDATELAVFLQSFYAQFPIIDGIDTPTFTSLSVGGTSFSLGDNNGNPGFAQGNVPFNAVGYLGVTSSGATDNTPAQYQVASYLLVGVT